MIAIRILFSLLAAFQVFASIVIFPMDSILAGLVLFSGFIAASVIALEMKGK